MATEDLTTYMEVDPQNVLTVSTDRAQNSAPGIDSDHDCYLYKDFGPDYFDALDLEFTSYMSSGQPTNSQSGVGYSNTIDDYNAWAAGGVVLILQSSDVYNIKPNLLVLGGASDNDYTRVLSFNTLYYWTITRAAGADIVYARVYTDSARTNLLHTWSVSGLGTVKWQYFYPFVNYNSGTGGVEWSGYFEYFVEESILPKAFKSWAIVI